MSDQALRDKVIKGLECCIETIGMCWDNPKCPYNGCEDMARGEGCMSIMVRDALALLKAQEPVKPVFERQFMSNIEIYDCGKCGTSLGAKGIAKYCMKCGQAVKWK